MWEKSKNASENWLRKNKGKKCEMNWRIKIVWCAHAFHRRLDTIRLVCVDYERSTGWLRQRRQRHVQLMSKYFRQSELRIHISYSHENSKNEWKESNWRQQSFDALHTRRNMLFLSFTHWFFFLSLFLFFVSCLHISVVECHSTKRARDLNDHIAVIVDARSLHCVRVSL